MSDRFAVSIDVIKAGLIAGLDTLVPSLFPNARRHGAEWVMGDVHGAPGGSLSIRRTGAKAGCWKDFSTGVGGDVLTLVAAGACAGDLKDAIPWSVRYLGLGGLSDAERRAREREAERTKAAAAAAAERDAADMRRRARGHWHSAVPIAGTPADLYLLGRGIDIRQLRKPPGSLRFKPMVCPETRELRPCLLAIVVDGLTGHELAVHRTFLHQHADGRWTKADAKSGGPMREAKRAYAEYAGGFIPLARGASGRPIKDAPHGEPLTLSEGIEDGLSVALAMPGRRVGAALSLSNLGAVRVPAAIGGICIAAQNDTAAAAIAALGRARARLDERGLRSLAVHPPAGVKDWNDMLRGLLAAAAGEARGVA